MRVHQLAPIVAVLVATTAFAQSPVVENGKLETHAVTRGLTRQSASITERLAQAAWIGYAVKIPVGDRGDGCWSADRGYARRPLTTLKLEGPDELYVLYRIADRMVDRIKIAS